MSLIIFKNKWLWIIVIAISLILYVAYYIYTHPKDLIVETDFTKRVSIIRSPLGRVKFNLPTTATKTDTTIKQSGKYELGYRAYDSGKVEIYLVDRRKGASPYLYIFTIENNNQTKTFLA